MQQTAKRSGHEIQVWDVPTRIFHWALVVLVCLNLFVVSPDGGVETVIHFVTGFAILGLLIFRWLWGFIGSRYSRFSDFIYRPSTTLKYGRDLLRRQPKRVLGHNPLGGWMIMALLVVLTAMVMTGLFASTRHAAGPLAHLVSISTSSAAGPVHSILSNILIALIVGHLGGVAYDWFLTRENLVRAMFTGRKAIEPGLSAPDAAIAPLGRALVVVAIAIAVAIVLIASTDYSATRDTLRALGG